MKPASLKQRVAQTLTDELGARGDAGHEALAWLEGRDDGLISSAVSAALADAWASLSKPPQQGAVVEHPGVRDLVGFHTFVLVGDLHGRLDAALRSLVAAGILDEDGRWCASAGTCLLLVGDVIHADLTWRFAPSTDPAGRALIRAFGHLLEAARTEPGLPGPCVAELEAALSDRGLEDGDQFARRHAWVGALLVDRTVRDLRRLEQEAADAGGVVVVLKGNHELDLLSGRFWWQKSQKRRWLGLLGLIEELEKPGAIELAAGDRGVLDGLSNQGSALRWLQRLPVAARAGRVLAVHGGPTRALTEALLADDVATPGRLFQWLSRAADVDFASPFFAEGRSMFSPLRAFDDFVTTDRLVTPWLLAADCDWLAVGHSPFYGFPRDAWPDPDDPAVAQRLGRVERLGVLRGVLKLDTNLKRGARCEVVRYRPGDGVLERVGAEGRVSLLDGDTTAAPWAGSEVRGARRAILRALDSVRGPSLADLSEPGLEATEVHSAFELLDAAEEVVGGDEVRQAAVWVVRAGPSSLEPLRALLRGIARHGGAQISGLLKLRDDILERAVECATRVDLAQSPIRLLLDGRDTFVGGVRYRLLELVVASIHERAGAAGLAPRPIVAGELVLVDGAAGVRVSWYEAGACVAALEASYPLDAGDTWAALESSARRRLRDAETRGDVADSGDGDGIAPPDCAPSSLVWQRTASGQTAPGVIPVAALEALLAANRPLLARACGVSSSSLNHGIGWDAAAVTATGDGRRGWVDLTGPWPRLRAVFTGQHVLLADTAFVDPGEAWYAVEPEGRRVPAYGVLSEALGNDPVVLHAYLKRAVVARARSGATEELGLGVPASAVNPWGSGCYVFTSPLLGVCRRFEAHNPVGVTFEVPLDVFTSWQRLGWLRAGLMVSDDGGVLDPTGRWGGQDVAVEVVAVGAEGVRALWSLRTAPAH